MMLISDLRRFGLDWNPWTEMRRLRQQMHRMMEGSPWGVEGDYPLVNVWTDVNDVIVQAEIPGVAAEDLDIQVQGNTMTLRGSRAAIELGEGETFHRRERGSGDFVRTLQLPFEVNAEKVEAQLKKGILEIRLPRLDEEKVRKIQVKVENKK